MWKSLFFVIRFTGKQIKNENTFFGLLRLWYYKYAIDFLFILLRFNVENDWKISIKIIEKDILFKGKKVNVFEKLLPST